jgi:hypothetical protein
MIGLVLFLLKLLQLSAIVITVIVYIIGCKTILKDNFFGKAEKFLWYLMVLVFNFVGLLLYFIYKRHLERTEQRTNH